MPCEDEGRDQGDAAGGKEHQRLSADHLKLGERPETEPSERTHPADTLILAFQPL